jgi:sulfite reductase (NADPH) hemoprotein beta-component
LGGIAGCVRRRQDLLRSSPGLDILADGIHVYAKMSGCMNACGHHHVGHIGILGVDKHGEEWYQITLGGSVNGFTALGDVIGPSVRQSDVAATIQRIVDVYRARREDGERFIETYRRIGPKPFKAHVYATSAAARGRGGGRVADPRRLHG